MWSRQQGIEEAATRSGGDGSKDREKIAKYLGRTRYHGGVSFPQGKESQRPHSCTILSLYLLVWSRMNSRNLIKAEKLVYYQPSVLKNALAQLDSFWSLRKT